MKRASDTRSLIPAINERHIPTVDKFFRMCAGASSKLLALGKSTFQLEIRIDQRVTGESAPRLVWNIAQSWRNQNPELGDCLACIVCLHRSPGPTGFMLPASGRPADDDAEVRTDPLEIAARIHEIESASRLPAPLLARYFLSFTLFEGIGKIQKMSPAGIEN